MYFQVYYHPVGRSYECILESIYTRIKDLVDSNVWLDESISAFLDVLQNSDNLEAYIELDDAYVNGFIKQFTKSSDPVLNKLANAFINRKLFSFVDLANEPTEEFLNELHKKYETEYGKYFYKKVSASGVAYMKSKKSDINDIKVLLPNGKIKSLDQYSPIIKSLSTSSSKTVDRIYFFED